MARSENLAAEVQIHFLLNVGGLDTLSPLIETSPYM